MPTRAPLWEETEPVDAVSPISDNSAPPSWDETFEVEPEQPGIIGNVLKGAAMVAPEGIENAAKRGWLQSQQADAVANRDAKEIARLTGEINALPQSPAMKRFNESKGIKDVAKAIAADPLAVFGELTAESLGSYIPTFAKKGLPYLGGATAAGAGVGSVAPGVGTAAGAAVGARVGMPAASAVTSYHLETAGKLIETLQEHGVDPTKPEQLEAAFANQELMAEAINKARLKGVPIAVLDAVSAGIAGRTVAKPAKTIGGKVLQGGKEALEQSGLGMLGEGISQPIAGEEFNLPAIAAEGLAEIPGSAGEVATGVVSRRAVQSPAAESYQTLEAVEPGPATEGPPAAQSAEPIQAESESRLSQAVAQEEANKLRAQEIEEITAWIEERKRLAEAQRKASSPFDDETRAKIAEASRLDFERRMARNKERVEQPQQSVSMPVMITRQMEADLKERGYSDEDIYKMKPQEANDILAEEQLTPEELEQQRAFEDEARAEQEEALEGFHPGSGHTELLEAIEDAGGFPHPKAADKYGLEGELEAVWSAVNDPRAQKGAVRPRGVLKKDAPHPDALAKSLRDRGFNVETGDEVISLFLERLRRGKPMYANAESALSFSRQQQSTDADAGPERITEAAMRSRAGKVYTGKNHLEAMGKMGMSETVRSVFGFVTNKGRFVNREEAHALAASYLPKLSWGGVLHNEDLKTAQKAAASDDLSFSRQQGRKRWQDIAEKYEQDLIAGKIAPADLLRLLEETASDTTPLVETETASRVTQPTSTRNKTVAQEREQRGIPQAEQAARRDFGTVWDEAEAVTREDRDAPKRLVDSLEQNPRAVSDKENALLLRRQIEVQNEHAAAIRAVNSAKDESTRADAVQRLETARNELQKIYDVGQSAGTETGRGLSARRMLARDDFSLAKMEAETRAVLNNGKPLSQKQAAEVKKLHDEIESLRKQVSDYEARETFTTSITQARKGKQSFQAQIKAARERIKAQTAEPVFLRGRTNLDPTTQLPYSLPQNVRAKSVPSTSKEDQAAIARLNKKLGEYKAERTGGGATQTGLVAVTFDPHQAAVGDIGKAQAVAKALGVKITWFRDQGNREGLNGVLYQGRIFINIEATRDPVHIVTAHEVTHNLKNTAPAIYRQLEDAVVANAKKRLLYDYNRISLGYSKQELNDELVADFVAESVANPVRLAELLGKKPNVVQKVVAAIRQVIERIKTKLGVKKDIIPTARETIADLEKVEAAMQNVFRQFREQTGRKPTIDEATFARQQQPDDTTLNDYAIVGAGHIAEGAKDFKAFSEAMVNEFGEGIRPKLAAIHTKAVQFYNQATKGGKLTPEERDERALEGDKKRIRGNIARMEERAEKRDFEPKPKPTPRMDKEKAELLYRYQQAKEKYLRGLFEHKLSQQSAPRKALRYGGEVINTARALMTSFDLSAVLRQGGFIAFGNPGKALKALPAMFSALRSEKNQFRVNEEIRNRPNAALYKQAKLYLADERATSLSAMEEAYMSRWAAKIPGVGASQRAYTTFLNKLRADSFDALVKNLSKNGKPTLPEARAIANFVNVATGRGNLGGAAQAAVGLNTIFFAPRYVLSRFQLLAGQPLYGGTGRTKRLIAKEYAKTLAGAAIVYSLGQAAGADIELDPKSTDFLKLRFGNTRVDPLFGLLQVSVFASREAEAFWRFVTQSKKKDPKYGSGGEVLGRFLRTKLSPSVGTGVDVLAGKNVVGEKVTPAGTVGRLFVPISFGDIYRTMQEQGVEKGAVFGILSLFGMGLQTYEPKKKKTASISDELERRRRDDIAESLKAA